MITVTTERHGEGWRWLLVDANGQRVLTGTQVYVFQRYALQMGQLRLRAARHYPIEVLEPVWAPAVPAELQEMHAEGNTMFSPDSFLRLTWAGSGQARIGGSQAQPPRAPEVPTSDHYPTSEPIHERSQREAWLLGQLVEAWRQLEAGIDRLRALEERLTP